jgi:hypothetical protein
LISGLLWFDAVSIQWSAFSSSRTPAIAFSLVQPRCFLGPGDPGFDDGVVNLDPRARPAALDAGVLLDPPVERTEWREPLMLLNGREDSADLEKGLILIVFELDESRASVVLRQAFDWRRSALIDLCGFQSIGD